MLQTLDSRIQADMGNVKTIAQAGDINELIAGVQQDDTECQLAPGKVEVTVKHSVLYSTLHCTLMH